MRRVRLSPETLLSCLFALIALLWGGFLGSRQLAGLDAGLDRPEYLTLDWRFLAAGAQPAPRGVVIAAIDDETVRAVGGYPLPRDVLAKIIRTIAAHGAQAIALDMLFLDPGKADIDAQLADALAATRSVVAATGLFERDGSNSGTAAQPQRALVPATTDIRGPISPIRDAARTGLVNVSTDYTGVPRYAPMIFRSADAVAPSFVLATASAALNTEPVLGLDTIRLAGQTVSLDLGYHLPIRYYGPRGSIRQFSAAAALRGDLRDEDVRGQVVIIGATALGLGDTFATPFDRIVPGVEILGTAVSNLLAGDALIRTSAVRRIDAAVAVLLPLLAILLMSWRRISWGLVLTAALTGAWVAAAFIAFRAGYWLNVAIPLAAVLPVAGSFAAVRLIRDRHAVDRVTAQRTALSRLQSPLLLREILKDPNFLERPLQRDVAVVFLDLAGFTGVAERLGPKRTRDLLAEFQALVDRDVVANDGFVANFMGDGAMIIFGLTDHDELGRNDAKRALNTIAQLHASLAAWATALPPAADGHLTARIGGHFGPVILSRLGAASHQNVTASGDTVNVASRLLEIAKQQQVRVVVSQDLLSAADQVASVGVAMRIGPVIDVELRGRAQSLRVHALSF
jgi:adenylate cyclase